MPMGSTKAAVMMRGGLVDMQFLLVKQFESFAQPHIKVNGFAVQAF